MKAEKREKAHSAVTLERQPEGATLIFVAETRNAEELFGLQALFSDLEQGCRVLPLAIGPLLSYAVRCVDDTDPQELASLLETVASSYQGRVESGFNPSFYRHNIEEFALEVGSELTPLSHCDLCGHPDPFPTRLALEDGGKKAVEGLYCERCVARLADGSERELIGAFLHADPRNFGLYQDLRLSSRPIRRGNQVRFLTSRSQDKIAATG